MSIKASNWAWSHHLPPSQKVLLLALADQADDDGVCWPSMKTLAKKICANARTAQRNMRELEAAGLVSVESRFRPDGDATSNLYRLAMTPSPPGKMPPPRAPRQNAPTPMTAGPVGVVTSTPPQEPSYRSLTGAAASRARDPAAGAAADKPKRSSKYSVITPSGIVCWIDPDRGLDDRQEGEKIEANATPGEVCAAVAAVAATGKSPSPGLVWREIQRQRAARKKGEQAERRAAEGPLAFANRRADERKQREANPVARRACDAAAAAAAAKLARLGIGRLQHDNS